MQGVYHSSTRTIEREIDLANDLVIERLYDNDNEDVIVGQYNHSVAGAQKSSILHDLDDFDDLDFHN